MVRIVAAILAAGCAGSVSAAGNLPDSLDLSVIRGLVVQHDGRWPPLDTVARDVVWSVTGAKAPDDREPLLHLLAWTFDPGAWSEAAIIPIKSAELRRELELPASHSAFSYAELVSHPRLRSLIAALAEVEEGRKLNPLEAKVSEINGKLATLNQVFKGQIIKPIPHPTEFGGAWRTIASLSAGASERLKSISTRWGVLREAFLSDDAALFAQAARELVAEAGSLPAAHRPDPEIIARELQYNAKRPFRAAWVVFASGAVLSAVAVGLRSRWFDVLVILGLLAGFGILTYGLWLRWSIAGRIPASNMFESLLFLGWGMGAFAIVAMLAFRQRIIPLTASVMGALALALADCLPMDGFIRPIPPVLSDTIWMSIHVPLIMVSYSVLALGVLFAHMQLFNMAVLPASRRAVQAIDSLHYWYIHVGSVLLAAGIITGSMWAASSWGRYWGWDPKEVWSLVAFLGYLTILHVRIDHERVPRWAYVAGGCLAAVVAAIVVSRLGPLTISGTLALAGAGGGMAVLIFTRGPFATAVKSILCFWLIIMTYVGVNYVLGIGLHSYGFGSGAMARYMFLIGGCDLGITALLSLVYLLRNRSDLSPSRRGLTLLHPA